MILSNIEMIENINFGLVYQFPSDHIVLYLQDNTMDNNAAAMEFYRKVELRFQNSKDRQPFIYLDSDEDLVYHCKEDTDSTTICVQNCIGDDIFKMRIDKILTIMSFKTANDCYDSLRVVDGNIVTSIVFKNHRKTKLNSYIEKMCERVGVPANLQDQLSSVFTMYCDNIIADPSTVIPIHHAQFDKKYKKPTDLSMYDNMAKFLFKGIDLPDWIDTGYFIYLASVISAEADQAEQ